jgi:multidrug resistance efflux pump
MLRIVLIVAALASVVTLGVVIDSRATIAPPTDEPAAVGERIFAPGIVEGVTESIELRPQVAGRIVEVLVHVGQTVAAGDPLVKLDDREDQQQVELAAAQLEMARSQLERLENGAHAQERQQAAAEVRSRLARLKQAQKSWERIERLRRESAVAQQQADDQQSLLEAATAEYEAAEARFKLLDSPPRADEVRLARARIRAGEAELELAKVQLDRCTLRAPTSAQILDVSAEVGELAGPTSTRPPITLADTSRLRVRAFVEEYDAPRVREGMIALITADGIAGDGLKGQVTRLSPQMTRKQFTNDQPGERLDVKTREVWIDLDVPAGGEVDRELVVGLRVDVVLDAILEAERRP